MTSVFVFFIAGSLKVLLLFKLFDPRECCMALVVQRFSTRNIVPKTEV